MGSCSGQPIHADPGHHDILRDLSFMFTALVFSFAVLSALRGRQLNIEMPILQITPKGMADEVPAPEQVTLAPVLRKRYHNPVSDFMLNALLKKE